MVSWQERPSEVSYLLNPAFCGRIIYNTISEYYSSSEKPFPLALMYLILPLVLHKNTRELINSRTAFTNWIQNNPKVLIGFPRRAREMVTITNEAIEYLLQSKYICIDTNGEFIINVEQKKMSKTKFTDHEVKECINKAGHIGKWFASTGKVENIYISLGVRP